MAETDRRPVGLWRRIDDAIYAAETWVVVGASAVMIGAVFLAVVWRIFASPEGKLQQLLQHVLHNDAPWVATLADGVNLGVWLALCVFGLRTARKKDPWWKALAWGLGVGVAVVILGHLYVWILPGGIIWSQRLALSLMMWVVLLGSSMAAYNRRHIFVQAAQKLVPPHLLRAHGAVVHFGAAAFLMFLTWVGAIYAAKNLVDWVESDMHRGIFESLAIPYWAVTVAVPIGFFLTGVRFLAQGIGILRGDLPPTPPSEEIEAAQSAAIDLPKEPST